MGKTQNQNAHFNCRLPFYISDLLGAVVPSSVQLALSQLATALMGMFVLNTVYIIRHYIYSTCNGLYLCEAVWDFQIIVQYHGTEIAYNCVILSRQFQIAVQTVTYRLYTHTAVLVKCSDYSILGSSEYFSFPPAPNPNI